MMVTVERRYLDLTDVDIRAGSGGTRLFSGYAAVFNQWADIGGMFKEQIAPGSFRKTIREADVPFVSNHDDSTVMARTSNGLLRLKEDKTGLRVEADLSPRDTDAASLITKLEDGNISKMSFAFGTLKDEWNEESTPPERTVREVKLYDVSPVTSPAYEGTSAQIRTEARSLLEARGLAAPEDTDAFAQALQALVDTPGVPDIFDSEQVRAVIQTLEALISRAEPPTGDTPAEHSLDLEAARRRLAIHRKRMALTA